jgi:hypothetical protein
VLGVKKKRRMIQKNTTSPWHFGQGTPCLPAGRLLREEEKVNLI